jgi:hypothetical protein
MERYSLEIARITGCESFGQRAEKRPVLYLKKLLVRKTKRHMRCLILSVLALVLSSCATFNQREVTYLRTAGLPPPVLVKLERGEPLTPPEIITLARRDVPDHFIFRHLADHGVNYLVTQQDILRMRSGGVSARVIDAVVAECELFARRYAEPTVEFGTGLWWVGSPYYGPELYNDGWW